MALKLLIVDDHEGFREFARKQFEAEGFEVAGEAADGETALEMVDELHPDAVLLDVQLPGIDGIEVARQLAERPKPPMIVLTSSREASEFGARLAQTAARGFIEKQELSVQRVAALVSDD